jgi:hypothetical protein
MLVHFSNGTSVEMSNKQRREHYRKEGSKYQYMVDAIKEEKPFQFFLVTKTKRLYKVAIFKREENTYQAIWVYNNKFGGFSRLCDSFSGAIWLVYQVQMLDDDDGLKKILDPRSIYMHGKSLGEDVAYYFQKMSMAYYGEC